MQKLSKTKRIINITRLHFDEVYIKIKHDLSLDWINNYCQIVYIFLLISFSLNKITLAIINKSWLRSNKDFGSIFI